MNTTLLVAGATSALLFTSSALAQAPAAPSAAPAAPAAAPAAPASFTDAQLSAFAEVTLELQAGRTAGTLDAAQTAAAVEASGLTVEQYNQIAAQMRTDPAFNARIQQLAQAGASQGASSSPAAPEATTTEAAPADAAANEEG